MKWDALALTSDRRGGIPLRQEIQIAAFVTPSARWFSRLYQMRRSQESWSDDVSLRFNYTQGMNVNPADCP
ncbi:hypothetical protein CC2G_014353 [Coprinopsis cinerea AmutBmut pab1-1]|nr:hypothetical protein CC2G_014353 [Coprinopsis cinerea AmutBmut pab1-1]